MSATTPSGLSSLQSFLDDAVGDGVAPGFQCVVFNRRSYIFNGVSGLASVPSSFSPQGRPLKRESLLWLASMTKISLSLIVLHLIERGLTNSGFTMNDLDSHEALIKVLPEFKHGSGSPMTKIIEGFEDELGSDGKKVMKLKEARGRVTLRMLLTHTAGMAYPWNDPYMLELYDPSDSSVPNRAKHRVSGAIRDFEVPLVVEPGTSHTYGPAADWLGQFAVRSSGRSLRQLFKDIIFAPLSIPPTEADLWISPSLSDEKADIHTRDADTGFLRIPFSLYATEEPPPEGKSYSAGGGVWASLQAYARVFQAVLNEEPKILSKEVWRMAMKDDLETRGIQLHKPEMKTTMPIYACNVEEFAKSTAENGSGVNLLQCRVATAPTSTGRSTGSISWAGIANTYFFIDPIKGIGAALGTQLLPFYDPRVIAMRDKLEALIYDTLFAV